MYLFGFIMNIGTDGVWWVLSFRG